MRDKVLVVGGYGDVGGKICNLLADQFAGRVIAAGRNMDKGRRFSESTGGKVLAREIDIYREVAEGTLSDVQLCIMALDLKDLTFVENCLSQGIGYIDVSATYEQINGIVQLHSLAEQNGATGIVSVGLAPGLSNLLAKYCTMQMDDTYTMEIGILLGLGEDHGEASIDWVLQNLQKDFTLKVNGKSEQVRSFQSPRGVDFPDHLGRYKAYAFNFSDQYVIAENLRIPEVRTRLAFESKFVTNLFYQLSRWGFFRLLRYSWFNRIMKFSLMKLKMGTDVYALKVEAYGTRLGEAASTFASVSGRSEAYATAMVAAKAAEQLLTDPLLPKGVHHIESLFEPKSFIQALDGVRFSTGSELFPMSMMA